MRVQSYVIEKDVLTDSEYELLCNISGAWNAESSFAVKISDIKDCLEITKEVNDGSEVMDCSGRKFVPNYDSDINFMTKLIDETAGCEYIIVEFTYGF